MNADNFEPDCPICGGSMYWDDCDACGGEGFWTDDDGDPDDCPRTGQCDYCDGNGGAWLCPNFKRHPETAAPQVTP